MVDKRADSGIGGAQHRAFSFERAHLRNLQVLMRCAGVAEPGIVTDVDQQVGRWQVEQDVATEDVFEADGDTQPVALYAHQLLLLGARGEIRVGNADDAAEPVQQPAHRVIFAEQNQVTLVIEPTLGAELHDAIVKLALPRLGIDHSTEDDAVVAQCGVLQSGQQRALELARMAGQCGLGPDDQIAVPVLAGLAPVGPENMLTLIATPFQLLRNIALHHGDAQRLRHRLGPVDLLQQPSRQRNPQQQRQHWQALVAQQQKQRHGHHQAERADAVNADQRRETG